MYLFLSGCTYVHECQLEVEASGIIHSLILGLHIQYEDPTETPDGNFQDDMPTTIVYGIQSGQYALDHSLLAKDYLFLIPAFFRLSL